MKPTKMLAITVLLVVGLAPGLPVRAQGGNASPLVHGSSVGSRAGTDAMVDFNADGFADLAIGVPGEDIGSNLDAGAVNVLYGSTGGLSATSIPDQLWSQDTTDVEDISEAGDAFGRSLATGDFDGDGFTDLAVGVRREDVDGNTDAGAVNVLYGATGGLSAAGDQFWSQNSSDIEGVAEPNDHFGDALAAGDFNGDGFDDLAVGVPNEDIDGNVDAGAVNVLYGSAGGLSAAVDQLWSQNSTDVEEVAEAGDSFGSALAVADFGKNSRADLAVGVPGEDLDGTANAGAVNVLYGRGAGLSAIGDQLWHQDSPDVEDAAESGDSFGRSLAAGNFGNSIHSDLAVGVPGEDVDVIADAGAVNVLYGSTAGLSATGDQFWSQDSTDVEDTAEAGDFFGQALAAADFGNSVQADLAVGVPGEDIDVIADAGAVNVLHGSALGLNATADQFWNQDSTNIADDAEASDGFGGALAAGNFGSSAQADLAVGAPVEGLEDNTLPSAGVVNVLYGTAEGLSAAADQLWSQNSANVEGAAKAGDLFGFALAASR